MQAATNAQLQYLRNLYEPAIGYQEANRWVEILRIRKITSREASREITRLLGLKSRGQYAAPMDYKKEKVAEEDDPNYNAWWKK